MQLSRGLQLYSALEQVHMLLLLLCDMRAKPDRPMKDGPQTQRSTTRLGSTPDLSGTSHVDSAIERDSDQQQQHSWSTQQKW